MQIENCKFEISNCETLATHVSDQVNTPGATDAIGTTGGYGATGGLDGRSSSIGQRRSRFGEICNLQFLIFNFQCFSVLTLCALLFALPPTAAAQTISDKTVASVTNGSQSVPDIITYSDLVWQLALEPGRPFSEHPSSEALTEALGRLEEQLLVLQEARKLPLAQSPEALKDFDDAVKKTRDDLAARFGSAAQLQERMRRVGLTSEQLDQILRDRVTMERYVDFRFRPFALVSAKEISDRYEKEAAALRGGGRIIPTLEKEHDRIERDLIEEKIQGEIDKFIEVLRDQPGTEIVILSPV